MDFDKAKLNVFINYFLEDSKIVVRIPLKKSEKKIMQTVILGRFNLSNKIYLTKIN
jgi:hypothetical protein